MLPEIGGLEWLVIAVVALIVIGPKDLPVMMRKLGQFVAKLRGMANEFRASFDEMARQSELDELRKEVEAMRRGQFGGADYGHTMVNEIEQQMAEVGVQLNTPMSYQYDTATAPPPLEMSDATLDVPPAAEPPPKKTRSRKATNGAAEPAGAPAPAGRAKRAAKAKPAADTDKGPKPRKRAAKIVEGGA